MILAQKAVCRSALVCQYKYEEITFLIIWSRSHIFLLYIFDDMFLMKKFLHYQLVRTDKSCERYIYFILNSEKYNNKKRIKFSICTSLQHIPSIKSSMHQGLYKKRDIFLYSKFSLNFVIFCNVLEIFERIFSPKMSL